jgi:LacI family transcriptional regulator
MSLRQVAKEINVSIATVSNVLTSKGRMAPETRREIERKLREAGIKPNYKRRPVFFLAPRGVIVDEPTSRQVFQAYDGLNTSFHEADLTLRIEFVHAPDPETLQKQLQQLLSYEPGAVVLSSTLNQDLQSIGRFFEKNDIPAIQFGHTAQAMGIDGVVVDSFAGAHKAVRWFIEHGHRKIATIRWNTMEDPASNKKYAGYTCALEEAGIARRPEYVVESPFTRYGNQHPGRVAVEQLLALKDAPTAVFVENTFITPSLIHTVEPGEREIPASIRALDMIHFEAFELEWIEKVMHGKLGFPARNAKLLRTNWHELGRMTAARVVARLSGPGTSSQIIQLIPQLYDVTGFRYTSLEPE